MKRALPAIAWGAALFGLSSIPGENLTMMPDVPHFDKFAHLGLYTVFGFLVARALPGRGGRADQPAGEPLVAAASPLERPEMGAWVVPLVAVAIGAAYGASDEWHQAFVPGRSCSFWDWVSDCAGTALGVAAWATAGGLRVGRRRALDARDEPEV